MDALDAGTEVTAELLIDRGLIREGRDGLKVLGDGDIKKGLTVRAHKFSKSAAEKIQNLPLMKKHAVTALALLTAAFVANAAELRPVDPLRSAANA